MPIVVTCPKTGCGRRYSVPDEAAGRTATCASCGAKIQIPAAGIPAESEAPPPPPPPPPAAPHARYDDDEHDVSVVRRRPRPPSSGGFVDFLVFRWLITPRILILVYWILVVLIELAGLGVMISGFFAGGDIGRILGGVLGGLFVMIVGPVVYRIVVESLIVVFRIYDTLIEIRDNTSSESEP